MRKQLPHIVEDLDNGLSLSARDYLSELYGELVDCDAAVAKYDVRIKNFAITNEDSKRLQKIPGVGPLTATAIVAHVGSAKQFKNGRAFAACIGLTPKEHSSGGKQKLLGISKRGEPIDSTLLSFIHSPFLIRARSAKYHPVPNSCAICVSLPCSQS